VTLFQGNELVIKVRVFQFGSPKARRLGIDRQRGDHLPDPRTDVRPRMMADLALSPTMKYVGFGDKKFALSIRASQDAEG
jgi:hypothetical protein